MKRTLIPVLLILITTLLSAGVSYSYDLGTPEIKTRGEYTVINLPDASGYGTPGQPDLPWKGVRLLLPDGNEAVKISVERSAPVSYTLESPVAPIQPQYPFSHMLTEPAVEPNAEIYHSALPYPQELDNGVVTHFLNGHPIAFAAVSPFEYHPTKNELVYYRQIRVTVDYQPGTRSLEAMNLLKNDSFVAKRLSQSVDNAAAIPSWRNRETGFEYLIVVDAAKYNNWLPLKALYESRGKAVELKTMAEITATSTGADTQAKLRNYIVQYYTANPLRYVLLAADTDVIPHRGFYVNMGQGGESDADIPADMYYSCLDGSWNDDGDNYWGEMYEADLAPEIAIGRYCYNTDEEIANFLNKVQSYLIVPVEAELKSAFFAGEWLWDGPTWGGDYMDEMIGGSSAHGYTTVGVPTTWNITTLYDRTYGAADSWDANDIRPLLSNGPNFVNHLGHSNTNYTMRLSNNQVSASTITNNGSNHNFGIYFTQGCYSGAFDNRETNPGSYTSDCIAERMTNVPTTAVGMIAHSRYGWGMQGSTDGASQYIHRQYNDAIFGENIFDLGYTLVDSKIDNIPFIANSSVMYWVTYETNLLGDPAMMVWTDTPQSIVANLAPALMVGVNNYQLSTNAPGAAFTLKYAGEIIYQGVADAGGTVNISLLDALIPGDYQYYLTAPNFYAFEGSATATAAQMPYVVCNNIEYVDADHLYHTGETVNINFYAKNVGMLDLTAPGSISLSSTSPNINVLTPSVALPALAAGDSLAFSGVLQIAITGSYEDLSRAGLVFTATYDTYSAVTNSFLILNAPELELLSYSINNPTFTINPGDNPTISFSINNSGSGNAYAPMMLLFSDCTWANLSAYELSLPPVGFDSTINYDDAITINISEFAPSPGIATITYVLSAENGNTLEGSFVIYVGMSSYGFEPDLQGFEVMDLDTDFTNQWHRDLGRNYTQNGTYAMKFGATGTGNYASLGYGAMVSPEMIVSPDCQLEFYHWMDAETHSNPAYAWDGGMVQMSLNNGPWTQITPVGGYPYRIYNNPVAPLAVNTYVYSGSFDWTQAIFPLGNVNGTARFRWVFGSDGAVAGEGWYIDEVRLTGVVGSDDPVLPASERLVLNANFPNPFNPTTTLSFNLPQQGPAKLEIFNVKGQLVNTLVDKLLPSGSHSLVWNGVDKHNRPVASGVYYYRLSTAQGSLKKKMILMK